MELSTASAVVSFYTELEERAERFYEFLAGEEEYGAGREHFLAFTKEDKRNRETVLRTYRESVTDAFETGYSFTGINEDSYVIDTELSGLSYVDALRKAVRLEEETRRFCLEVSGKTEALLGDLSGAFERVARKRLERTQVLTTLLNGTGSNV